MLPNHFFFLLIFVAQTLPRHQICCLKHIWKILGEIMHHISLHNAPWWYISTLMTKYSKKCKYPRYVTIAESHLSLKQRWRDFVAINAHRETYKKRAKEKDSKNHWKTQWHRWFRLQANITSTSSQTSKDFLCINDISDLLGVSRWTI